jgi:hypothetical protein
MKIYLICKFVTYFSLVNLLNETERSIQSIPQSIPVTVRSSSFFGIFRSESTHHISNQDKAAQRDYYTSIIRAREDTLLKSKKFVGDQEAVTKALHNDISIYETEREIAEKSLKALRENSKKRIDEIKDSIIKIANDIKKIDDEADRVEAKVGLKGKALLGCLVAIKAFGADQKKQQNFFQPMIEILKLVRSISEVGIEMLVGGKKSDVYAGGKLLLSSAGLFSGAGVYLRTLTSGSEELQKKIQASNLAKIRDQ